MHFVRPLDVLCIISNDDWNTIFIRLIPILLTKSKWTGQTKFVGWMPWQGDSCMFKVPRERGRCRDLHAVIRPGDVVLVRSNSKFSKLINAFEAVDIGFSVVSHAAIVDDSGMLVEALWNGVTRRSPTVYQSTEYIEVWRHKDVTTEDAMRIGMRARRLSEQFSHYSYFSIFMLAIDKAIAYMTNISRFRMFSRIKLTTKMLICSHVVALVYSAEPQRFKYHWSVLTPNDIRLEMEIDDGWELVFVGR